MKKSYVFAFLTIFIWSSMATIAKILLSEIPNLQTLAISGLFAFLFLVIVNVFNGSVKLLKHYKASDYIKMAELGFLGLFLYSALYYYGLSQLTAQEACIINYLWPIMLVFFSCTILHEPFTFKKIIAMLMSFAGIIVMSISNNGIREGSFFMGMISCIAAATCYGLFSVLNKKSDYNQNITMTVIWLTVAVCSFAAGPIMENWIEIKGTQWLGLLWLGVATDAIAYLLWSLALNSSGDSAKIANLAYLTPFLSIIVSAVFLKEKITINAILALLLIIGGILMQNINFRKENN